MRYIFSSLQWMMFILMGSIVIPIGIASSYGLSMEDTVAFVSRTLFVLGIAGILQSCLGHKLPVAEGPAGIWWGVFTLYAGVGSVLFGSNTETLRVLSFCFILSGGIFIVLSLLGLVNKIARLFTPTVMGVYLTLMIVQLSGTFLSTIMGIRGDSGIDPTIMILSIITVISAYLAQKIRIVKSYATLISIIIGWGLFIVFKRAPSVLPIETLFVPPKIFAFGSPRIEMSMAANVFCITLLLLTNLIASVKAVQLVLEQMSLKHQLRLRQTSFIAGVIHILAGVFSAIGPVPLSGSAAFISQTQVTSRIPFIMANILIVILSLSPAFMVYFAALPPAVGYAVLLPTFGFGTLVIAMTQFSKARQIPIRNFVVAVSLFVGIGIMFLPSTAFEKLPSSIASLLSNGLIIGMVLAVILERMMIIARYYRLRNLR